MRQKSWRPKCLTVAPNQVAPLKAAKSEASPLLFFQSQLIAISCSSPLDTKMANACNWICINAAFLLKKVIDATEDTA